MVWVDHCLFMRVFGVWAGTFMAGIFIVDTASNEFLVTEF